MDGIPLSTSDKQLIALSVLLPPLAIYLKFGKSRTFTLNCLFTACLFIPGIVHAIRSIYRYPSVVFRGKPEQEDGEHACQTQDGSVVWELPRYRFQSVGSSLHILDVQGFKAGAKPACPKPLAGSPLASKSKSQLSTTATVTSMGIGDKYVAHKHGEEPVLNPNYGWGVPEGLQHLLDPWALGFIQPLESIAIR